MSHIKLTLVDEKQLFFLGKGRWLKRAAINMTSPFRRDCNSTLTKEKANFVYNTMPYQCVIVMHGMQHLGL